MLTLTRAELAELTGYIRRQEQARVLAEGPPKTGWPPGMLQDDSRELSQWLASRPGARRQALEAAAALGDQSEKGNGCEHRD